MIVFWLITAALILAAYLLFWWTLRRPPRLDSKFHTRVNLDAHRQRRRELEQELADGKITKEQYHQLITELERDLLDLARQGKESTTGSYRGILPVFLTLGLIPFAALALYFSLGRPDLLTASRQSARKATPPSLQQAIAKIETRLRQHPEDLEGWILLARSYQATGQIDKALQAYRKALQLAPEHPDLLVRYAEALARSQKGDLSGEPTRVLQHVLKKHPDHGYALWLAGLAALQQRQTPLAERYWRRLLAQIPEGSRARQQLMAMMQKEGMEPDAPGGSKAARPVSLHVTVTLAPELADRADPDDPVFIFARAASGPPMPLAIVRKRVKDLPVTVVLDDSLAMMPQLKLSRFSRVIIGARVAKSGNAKGTPGDLEGWTQPVTLGQDSTYAVIIDQVRS